MLNLIAEGKQYRLSNGQVIIVKKITVINYYLLVMSFLIYKIASIQTGKINRKLPINKYIKEIKEHALDIAKVKVEYENIKMVLKNCVDINIEKLEALQVIETLSYVLDFNSISMGKGKELEGIEQLNEELEYKIGLICIMLKIAPSQALEMFNYDVCMLIRENNRCRVGIINDLRLAYHGDKNNYLKYTRGLMGEIVYTGDEIHKNPELLKQIVDGLRMAEVH